MNLDSFSSHPVIHEIYGHDLYEYLLVAHPDIGVNEKIVAEKQCFHQEYKEKISAKTQAHITIANFLAKESMEETLTRWIQRICTQQQSFTVTLNNYSGFPPHTIYLRVQNEQPFQKLANDLKVLNGYVNSCACPPVKIITKPYVSIAGKLPEDIYFKALTQYAHKTFHESFMVTELLLLKRKHQFEDGKKINVFGLSPEQNTMYN
ncbi:MAG: 2'-5' RNA ligase family protein [Ginsengibacter sp.]